MKTSKTLLSLMGVFVLFGSAGLAQTRGNGLPQSKLLFNLEIIAYDKNHCPQGEQDNGHRIAVQADVTDNPNGQLRSAYVISRQNDILLSPGDFQVMDSNACINGTAAFQLPVNPFGCSVDGNGDPIFDNDPACITEDLHFQQYLVFARLVGKPGTGVNVTTCATDPLTDTDGDGNPAGDADDIIVCSTESWVKVREKTTPGSLKPVFENVSRELLTLCVDTDDVLGCDTRLALFDPSLYEYFWNWNTQGKAHAQLFFMAIPD